MAANDKSQVAWAKGKPVLDRLPYYGYQDNPVATALTDWVDFFMSARKSQLEAFYRQLDPDLCNSASLDYLAYLVGFSGDFWDLRWPDSVKRAFIRESLRYLWQNRGTLACLERVLDIHGISRRLWQQNELVLPFRMPAAIGGQGMQLYIRLPLLYPRSGQVWQEAERTARNWIPAVVKSLVSFEYFHLGFSRIGEPMYFGATVKPVPKDATVTYGQTLSLSLQPQDAPRAIFYDVVPNASNSGTLAIAANGQLTYTPAATWGTRLADTIAYRCWTRLSNPVQRSFTVNLDPALKLSHSFASGVPEVNRGLTVTTGNATITAGELRASSNATLAVLNTNLTDANLILQARVRIVPGDAGQYYQFQTRRVGATFYLFRVTASTAQVFYFDGVGFTSIASTSFTGLAAGFYDFRVTLNGPTYEISLNNVVRLTGSNLINLASTVANLNIFVNTAGNGRVEEMSLRSL